MFSTSNPPAASGGVASFDPCGAGLNGRPENKSLHLKPHRFSLSRILGVLACLGRAGVPVAGESRPVPPWSFSPLPMESFGV